MLLPSHFLGLKPRTFWQQFLHSLLEGLVGEIEVDAASRTGVDDTRELLENAQYLPTRGRYKVYLIDEVHMLSTASFNALLIDRKEIKVHRSPIDIMIEEMGDVYSLIVFPEGGRSAGDEMGEFKSGLYYMGKKRPDLELVPVYIDNVNRILPRGEVLPVPLLSCITIGPPIFLEAGEPKTEFLKRARQAVLELKDR